MAREKFSTIDEYHASFSKEVRERLDVVRKTIREVAPQLKEVISYNIPAFRMNKMVVYYAAFKDHISIYPVLHFRQRHNPVSAQQAVASYIDQEDSEVRGK